MANKDSSQDEKGRLPKYRKTGNTLTKRIRIIYHSFFKKRIILIINDLLL
jgi:hypothetical protein